MLIMHLITGASAPRASLSIIVRPSPTDAPSRAAPASHHTSSALPPSLPPSHATIGGPLRWATLWHPAHLRTIARDLTGTPP